MPAGTAPPASAGDGLSEVGGPTAGDAPCAAAGGELLPPPVCAGYAQLKPAKGAFNAPRTLALDEVVPIRLVITRRAGGADAAADVDPLPGDTVRFSTRAGRYMRATLTGTPGLKIAARTPERQDLLTRPSASWDWEVTAVGAGPQILTLRTYVELAADQDGKLWEEVEDHPITVEVPPGRQASNFVDNLIEWLGTGRHLVLAMTALVTALGGLWFAIRTFGKTAAKPSGEGG